MKKIDDLIESERHRFVDGVQLSGFVTSWQAVDRYHIFLTLLMESEAKATQTYSEKLKAWMGTPLSPSQHLTEEQQHRLAEDRKAADVLHLEIESYYLFSKILLDTVARAIEKHFGQVRKCSLDSHHDLVNKFGKYTELKKLVIPSGFMEKAVWLKKNISDFRDYEIAHDKRLNRVTATALTRDGRATMIATSTVVPAERFKPQADSTHVSELMAAVGDYIVAAIEIVKTNRNKTKLKLVD